MVRHIVVVLVGVCMCMPTAGAQQRRISWLKSSDQGLREAQKNDKPVMFYVLASKSDRDDDLEREQERTLRSADVLKRTERFICVKLSRTRDRDFLKKCGIEPTANMVAFFTSPSGEVLDRISAGGLTQPDSVIQKLEAVLAKHRQEMLTSIEAVFENPDAKTRELTETLEKIRENELREADDIVVDFVSSEGLNKSVRRKCYGVLRELQTDMCVRTLFEHSFAPDEQLARAALSELGKCDPPAARPLTRYLFHEHPDAKQRAYETIGKICGIGRLKREDFWGTATEQEQTAEIERIKAEAKEAITKWNEKHGIDDDDDDDD